METHSLEKDLATLDELSKRFLLSNDGRRLGHEDRQDVIATLRGLIFRYPFDPKRNDTNGVPFTRERYFNQLATIAIKVWQRNRKICYEAQSQLQALNSDAYNREESWLDSIADPLSQRRPSDENDGGVLYRLAPSLADDLEMAPYTAAFFEETPPLIYSHKPLYVPPFHIIPKYKLEDGSEILARAKHSSLKGKRRNFSKKHLPKSVVLHLERRRSRMAKHIAEIIPEYLNRFGFFSLELKHMRIVADINKRGWSPSQIQRERRISENTYYALLATLGRRGWLRTWHNKKQREFLQYYPAFDRCKTLHSSMLLELETMTINEVLELCGPAIEKQLYAADPSEQAIDRELRIVRDRLREAMRNHQAEQDYDRKLKSFILDFVDRPVQTGMPISEIEDLFQLLTKEQRINLFCEAIRRKVSLFDVIAQNFVAIYADVLKPKEEAEAKEMEPTLQTFLLSMKGQDDPEDFVAKHGATLTSLFFAAKVPA